jgi:hypothetical protein
MMEAGATHLCIPSDRPLRLRTPPTARPRSGPADPPPLRNAVTPLMKGVGYGQGYRYVHADPAARDEMPCLPEQFHGRDYLRGGDSPPESADGSGPSAAAGIGSVRAGEASSPAGPEKIPRAGSDPKGGGFDPDPLW